MPRADTINADARTTPCDIAEAARADAELRYRGLVDAMGVAVYTTDTEGRLTFYNEAATVLWGCRPALRCARFCGAWKLYTSEVKLVRRAAPTRIEA